MRINADLCLHILLMVPEPVEAAPLLSQQLCVGESRRPQRYAGAAHQHKALVERVLQRGREQQPRRL